MENSTLPPHKEDHKILINIKFDQNVFSLPCKIYLPKTIKEEPQIYIFPNHSEFDLLPRLKGNCTFLSANKDHQITVIGENVHISGGNMVLWGDGLEEGYLRVYPSRLIIIQNNMLCDKNTIWFRLSLSLQLAPNEGREFHYDGSSKVINSEKKKFQLSDDFSITFLNCYRWLDDGKNRNITFPELIAEAEFPNPLMEDEIEQYVKLLDEFLLLVSFAEGQRVALPRMQVYSPDNICDIYRMNYSIPKVPDNHSFNNFEIYAHDFNNFINKAWINYKKSPHKDLLRSALVSQVSETRHSMESRFLSLFSGIETLILAYRKENDLEFVISDDTECKTLRKKIYEIIKNNDIVNLSKEKRKYIYSNVSSLNRISLHKAFEMFTKQRNVYYDDLWDFFGSKDGYSLTTIRNRLVHGYGINEKYIASFSVALDNLKLYAKRMLFSTLGWSYQESRSFRRDDTFVENWRLAKEVISNWE